MARPKKETITGPILGIGQRIRKIVDDYFHGIQAEFAEAVGRGTSTINGYITQEVIPDAEFFSILVYRFGYEGTWLLTGVGPEKRKGYRKKTVVPLFSEQGHISSQEAEWLDLQELQNLRLEYMEKVAVIMERKAERYRQIMEHEKAQMQKSKSEMQKSKSEEAATRKT